MSWKRLVIDGFGQLELNNVAFRRDGRIEAQCALDATDFASVPAENGMLLTVDRVNRTAKFADTTADMPIGIHYSTEHMYDTIANGLKDFKLERGTFLPRIGYLAAGDLFTTNCIGYDTDDFATEDDLKAAVTTTALGTTPLYGGVGTDGAIQVTDTKPSAGPVLLVVEATTMPDNQFALKFQVLEA